MFAYPRQLLAQTLWGGDGIRRIARQAAGDDGLSRSGRRVSQQHFADGGAVEWCAPSYPLDVLDQFGSRIKAGGVWRFELYEYVSRSTEHRGTRLHIWPDIKLTDAKKNYELWQDYLRCYKFDLDFDIDLATDRTYIFQAIYFTPQGKRIIESTQLKR